MWEFITDISVLPVFKTGWNTDVCGHYRKTDATHAVVCELTEPWYLLYAFYSIVVQDYYVSLAHKLNNCRF